MQPKGEIERTTFKIQSNSILNIVTLGKEISFSGCKHECKNGGKCEADLCKCSYNYLGRDCETRSFTKEENVFETSHLLGKNEAFHFFENVSSGSKEFVLSIEDFSNSKIGVIWNQFSQETDKLFMTRMTRGLKTDTQMTMLDQLSTSGRQEVKFKAQVNYVYLTLINYEKRTAKINIKIESKYFAN